MSRDQRPLSRPGGIRGIERAQPPGRHARRYNASAPGERDWL